MGPNAGGSLNLSSCIVATEDTLYISSMGILQYGIEQRVRRLEPIVSILNNNMKHFQGQVKEKVHVINYTLVSYSWCIHIQYTENPHYILTTKSHKCIQKRLDEVGEKCRDREIERKSEKNKNQLTFLMSSRLKISGESPPWTQRNCWFMMAASGRQSKESIHVSYTVSEYLILPAATCTHGSSSYIAYPNHDQCKK